MLAKSKTIRALLALAMIVVMGFALATPQHADAVSTTKLTAAPNGDSGNEVLGGKVTRVTWEGVPESGEAIASMTFTFPEGTNFATDRCKAMHVGGAEGLTTTDLAPTFTKEGQKLKLQFAKPQAADGGYLRVQMFDVVFPTHGGEMQLMGEYTLENGTVVSLGVLPALSVTESTWAQAASASLAEQDWVKAWNSVTFLNLFFNPAIAVRSLPSVFSGFIMALLVVALAFPCAIPIGLGLALMRMARSRVPRAIGSLYVNVVRGTPLFLQIYIVFFGLPLAGITLPQYAMAVIVLALNSGAYLCEIFRAGIQSIPKGQFEAARSLGMSSSQTMAFVIIPQTVRRVIPTMTSEFILLYKDTSLLASVGFMEVIMYAKAIVSTTGSITPYIVAACFYLVITLPLTKVVSVLEVRLATSEGGAAVKKKTKGSGRNSFGKKKDVGLLEPAADAADGVPGNDAVAVSDSAGETR